MGKRIPISLEILHHHRMFARGECDVGLPFGWRLPDKMIDLQDPVDVEAHAIIGVGVEAIVTGIEANGARPTDTELIGGDGWIWAPRTPVEVDRGILTGKDGGSCQRSIREILGMPGRCGSS